MRMRGTAVDAAQLGLCWASFFGAALGLMGCGNRTSDAPSDAPENAGGSLQTGGRSAGNAGRTSGVPGELAGSDDESQGGRTGTQGGLGGSGAGASGSGAAGETQGDPALAELPLPARCKPLSGAETDLLCTLHTACGGVLGANSCYHTGSGGWQCTCEAPNADRTYLVDGAVGLDACAVAAGLCSGPAPALDLGSCVATHEALGGSQGAMTCALDLGCQTPVPVDFAPGVGAKLYGGGSVRCKEVPAQNPKPGPRRVDCEANGKGGSKAYAVVANGVADACHPVLNSFLAPPDPSFGGYKSCVRDAPLASPNDCQLVETCFDSAPLTASVSIVKDPLSRDVSCGFDDAGVLTCGCGWESASSDPAVVHRDVFSFQLGPAAKPASCDFSRCPLDIHAEPTGPGNCPTGETIDEGDRCKGFFSCERPATLDGKPVTAYSQLDTLCVQAADQAIYCGCAVGDETASFRLNDGASLSDACTVARTGCLERVALPVGRASYASIPANPLPAP